MKIANRIVISLLAGTLLLVGCGEPKKKVPVQHGVAIDLPKLNEAFASAAPELQNLVMAASNGVRYGEHASALVALDRLAKAPGLTDEQKKIIGEVTEQVKQAASKAHTAPPQ